MYTQIFIHGYRNTYTQKMNMCTDMDRYVGRMSGWWTRDPGWRKIGCVLPTSQVFVTRSSTSVCLVPLSPCLSSVTILQEGLCRGFGERHESFPKLFRRSPVSDVEIISRKLSVEKNHDLIGPKKRTMTSLSKAGYLPPVLHEYKKVKSFVLDSDPSSRAR